MDRRELARYEMFNKVLAFGKQYQSDFDTKSKAITGFNQLGKIAKELENAKASQQEGGITAKSVRLDALRLDVQNILRTAQAIALDEPEFDDRFPLLQQNETSLLTAADAVLAQLQDPAAVKKFLAYELPADFVSELRESRAAVANVKEKVHADRVSNVQSTAAIDRLIGEGVSIVATLNAIMHNKYSRATDKLRAWHTACHINRAKRSKGTIADAATTQPVSSSGSAAATA